MASQPDTTGTQDAITLASEYLGEQGESSALYPVHRLDLVVGGLLVIARTKRAAAALSEAVSGEGIGKEYLALTEGKCPEGTLINYLSKDKRQNKALVCSPDKMDAKYSELDAERLALKAMDEQTLSLVALRLKTGRFHQIRAQLSEAGAPVVGDRKYGSKLPLPGSIALFAYRISFTLFGERISVSKLPDISQRPWSLFAEQINNLR